MGEWQKYVIYLFGTVLLLLYVKKFVCIQNDVENHVCTC